VSFIEIVSVSQYQSITSDLSGSLVVEVDDNAYFSKKISTNDHFICA
jgi:hypothetical protein